MIDPLRYRSLEDHLTFDEHDSPVQCWQCQQQDISTPAFFFCHECGKVDGARPFCQECFFDYHARKKGKEGHKPHPIVRGDPVIVQTLADGDGATFAKMHEWITLDYTLTTDESNDIIEDTFSTKQPLIFQSGCSGPCVHVQLLGCTDIAAADILGASDPYCAVYWKNDLAGVTTTKHMTLNPVWVNQTFVLPLAEDFMAALDGCNSSALFNAGALLPKLRIDLYDWDRLSKNDFLGQASISDADILRILRTARNDEMDEGQPLAFALMPKQSRGKLGIRVALRGKKLFVHVVQGENLPKADPYSLSDPYCEVYWNDKKAGKTVHIDDTLDPVWDLEIFVVKIDAEGPNSVEQSTLRIECLDWDQFGSDDVLGQIELKGWQIRDLAENNGEDGVMSGDEGSGDMGEVDMEKMYDFIQTFQKRNVDQEEEGIGNMIVGVPQDSEIQTGVGDVPRGEGVTSAGAATDVAPETRKKKRKANKRKQGGGIKPGVPGDRGEGIEVAEGDKVPAEEGLGGADAAVAETGQTDEHARQGEVVEIVVPKDFETDVRGLGAEKQRAHVEENYVDAHVNDAQEGPVRLLEELAKGGKEQGEAVRDAADQGEIGKHNAPDEAKELRKGRMEMARHGEETIAPTTAEEDIKDPGSQDLEDTGAVVQERGYGDIDGDATSGAEEGQKETHSGDTTGISTRRLADEVAHVEGNATEPETQENTDSAQQEDGDGKRGVVARLGVQEREAHTQNTEGIVTDSLIAGVLAVETGTIGGDATRPEVPGEGTSRLESNGSNTKGGVQSARNTSSEKTMNFPPGTDVENGGGGITAARAEPIGETKTLESGHPSVAVIYRDASVERFEEDRGVLLRYLDDKSTAWVATKLIPRLIVRDDVPVARNIFQRLWSQRNKVFHLHKRVLNVKRGLKVLLELAMTGCRMQWYPLQLTDEQSGANFVRGSVTLRFLFHTRGSVLRGLDVAVSHMSLGERARVEVRSDYGFGEVYAARKVPPYATLVFVAQVAAIGHRDARWVLFRRAVRDAIEDGLFRTRLWLPRFAGSRRLVGLLGALRRTKHGTAALDVEREQEEGEEEKERHGHTTEVEDGPQSGSEAKIKQPESTAAPEQRGSVVVGKPKR